MKWAVLRVSKQLVQSLTPPGLLPDWEEILRTGLMLPLDYRLKAVAEGINEALAIIEHEQFDDLWEGSSLPEMIVQLGREGGETSHLHSIVYQQGILRYPVLLYQRPETRSAEQPV